MCMAQSPRNDCTRSLNRSAPDRPISAIITSATINPIVVHSAMAVESEKVSVNDGTTNVRHSRAIHRNKHPTSQQRLAP